MSKKFTKLLFVCVSVPLLTGCLGLNSTVEDHALAGTDYYVECDKDVVLDPANFFDKNNSKNISLEEVELDSTLKTNASKYTYNTETKVVTTKGQDYLEIGEYEVTLNYKNKTFKTVKLIVQDSTPPKFTRFKKDIYVEKGAENLALSKYFKAVDEHWVTIIMNEGNFDKNICGDYKIKITVKDKYDNSQTRKSTVHVVPLSAVDNNEITLTTYANGETPRAHRHSWIRKYKTIHHEAVYETREVVDNEAYDEEVEKKITKIVHICDGCGKDITDSETAHFTEQTQKDENTNCTSYTSKTIEASGGTETVHHDKKTHTEKVETEPAYDEKIEDGWICETCNKTKA